jgi:hypothetical protein
MIPIGTSFELRQQAFSTSIVLEPEGVPAHVIFLVTAIICILARGVPEVDRLSYCAFVFVDEAAEDVMAVELPRCG